MAGAVSAVASGAGALPRGHRMLVKTGSDSGRACDSSRHRRHRPKRFGLSALASTIAMASMRLAHGQHMTPSVLAPRSSSFRAAGPGCSPSEVAGSL